MNAVDFQGTVSVISASTLFSAAWKGFAVLLAATALTVSMRRASAAWRHRIWVLALAVTGLLPLVSSLLPALNVPVLPAPPAVGPTEIMASAPISLGATTVRSSEPQEQGLSTTTGAVSVAGCPSVMRTTPVRLTWRQWLLVIWAAGFVLVLFRLLIGLACLVVFDCRCRPLEDASLRRLATRCSEYLKLRRSVALVQRDGETQSVPMVWGAFRPALLLPAAAVTWDRSLAESVLLHELGHVKRHDWLAQLLCSIASAMHWFNPLAWLAIRRLRSEQEKACDDLVLRAGIDGPDYAQHLVSLARRFARPRPMVSVALAMACSSQIEKRVRDILDPDQCRRGITRSVALLSLVVVTLGALPLAALQATAKQEVSPEEFLRIAGRVMDEEGRGLAGVSVGAYLRSRTGTRMAENLQSDAQGYFEITKVPRGPGDYEACHIHFRLGHVVPARVDDVFNLPDEQRRHLRVVMRKGHSVSGILSNAAGQPAPGVLVEIVPAWKETPNGRTQDWMYRRAAETDARGRFVIRGVNLGEYHIEALDVPSFQKVVTETTLITSDINDLELRLAPMVWPADQHPVDMLGMKVLNVNDAGRDAFALREHAFGVLILEPGKDVERFGLGPVRPGDCFLTVDGEPVRSAADLAGMLVESVCRQHGEDSSAWPSTHPFHVRVSYGLRRVASTGYRCEAMRLTKADVVALQQLYAQVPQTRPADVYPDFHAERNLAGVMLMSVKAACFSYMRAHDKRPPETLEALLPYLKEEQDMWHNSQSASIRQEFRPYDFQQWIRDNTVLYLSERDRASQESDEPILGYAHTMLERHGKTCVIYDNKVLDYEIVPRVKLESQLGAD